MPLDQVSDFVCWCARRSVARCLLGIWPVAAALFLTAFTSIMLFPFFAYVPMTPFLGVMLPQESLCISWLLHSNVDVFYICKACVTACLVQSGICMCADAVCSTGCGRHCRSRITQVRSCTDTISGVVLISGKSCNDSLFFLVYQRPQHLVSIDCDTIRHHILVELGLYQHVRHDTA